MMSTLKNCVFHARSSEAMFRHVGPGNGDMFVTLDGYKIVPIEKFIVGDIVQLKSGGPVMTINSTPDTDGRVQCIWFSADEHPTNASYFLNPFAAEFNVQTLKPA